MGPELLTSSFGLVCFGWGLGTFIGPPAAGYLLEQSQDVRMSMFLAGGLLIAGGGAMMVAWLLRRTSGPLNENN